MSVNLEGPADVATRRAERIAVLTIVTSRLIGVVQILLALGLAVSREQREAGLAALAVAILLENTALVTGCWRRGRVSGSWVCFDVAFAAAALLWGAWLMASRDEATWAAFVQAVGMLEAIIIGFGLRSLRGVVAGMSAVVTAYLTAAVGVHGGTLASALPDAVIYCIAGPAWLISRELRRSGRVLDEQRRAAVDQARELARVTEQARSARMLHDRVLQTLEMLARSPWIGDQRLRGHVAAEASWLRRFVERGDDDGSGGLLDALHQVCERHLRSGLTVQLNHARLSRSERATTRLSPVALEAVVGAMDEALVNVGKHAGVSCALVRVAQEDDGVLVSVVDQGRGFDQTTSSEGFGLRSSIIGRVRDAGGRASVRSSPGEGTLVELWVPWDAVRDGSGVSAGPGGRGRVPRWRRA